jgi:hypothetical protein
MQDQGLAPRPIPLGPRSRGWLISELEEWVEQRRAERDAKVAVVSAVPRHNQEMALQCALHQLATAEPHNLDALIQSLGLRTFTPALEPEDKAVLLSAIAGAVSRCWVKRSKEAGLTD